MKRIILLIYALLLATFSLSAGEYWHGEHTDILGDKAYHQEAYVSYKLPEFKEIKGKYVEAWAKRSSSQDGSYSEEDFTAQILFGSGMMFVVSLSSIPDIDDNGNDITIWDFFITYGSVGSSKSKCIREKNFKDFNSAKKEYEMQRDRFIKKLEAE